jgi:hypothetical protein
MPLRLSVSQEPPSFDQRLTDLQSQLDRLAVTLQQWREQQEHLKPAEDRLSELTRQCADIVSQWSTTNQRQERAVEQLEERVSAFSAAEERLHNDSAQRLRSLERAIEQEWTGIRQLHQAPVRELREQAAALGQLSVAAANSGISGLERAEQRLADIERALHQHLSGVSQRLDAAVAEMRARSDVPMRASESQGASGSSWPIEGVVRLHNQLRESAESSRTGVAPPIKPVSGPPLIQVREPEIESRLETLEQAIADRAEEIRDATVRAKRSRRLTWLALIASAAVLASAVGTGVVLREDARSAAARASDAQAKAQAAVATANQQVTAVRDEAARQVAAAREDAARAQAVGDVLAAPDIVRFTVAGAKPASVSGQVLWSRTRGVVFSGVRLPAAPPRMTYRLWLLTDDLPVDAGTFLPDESGRITFAGPAPPVPRPVVGAALTVEPEGGGSVPSDPSLIGNRSTRPPAPDPPQ